MMTYWELYDLQTRAKVVEQCKVAMRYINIGDLSRDHEMRYLA